MANADLKPQIKVAFASGTEELNERLVARMRGLFPDLPLYVVSEFPPRWGEWIPYHVSHSLRLNMARCRAALKGNRIRLAGALLVPNVPYRRMRLMALLLSPSGFLGFNENLDSFMLRPRSLPAIARHLAWRVGNYLRWQWRPGGSLYKWLWRARHPREFALPWLYRRALAAGWLAAVSKQIARSAPDATPAVGAPDGISVVVPSRNGRALLASLLPGVLSDLAGMPHEIIVVDNGSSDGTAGFLKARHAGVILETSGQPLSFARAVNGGIARARFSHVCSAQ